MRRLTPKKGFLDIYAYVPPASRSGRCKCTVDIAVETDSMKAGVTMRDGIVTLIGVGRKSSNPQFLYAAVAALSHTPNASVRRLLNWVRFRR